MTSAGRRQASPPMIGDSRSSVPPGGAWLGANTAENPSGWRPLGQRSLGLVASVAITVRRILVCRATVSDADASPPSACAISLHRASASAVRGWQWTTGLLVVMLSVLCRRRPTAPARASSAEEIRADIASRMPASVPDRNVLAHRSARGAEHAQSRPRAPMCAPCWRSPTGDPPTAPTPGCPT